jgi:hypothetical protein
MTPTLQPLHGMRGGMLCFFKGAHPHLHPYEDFVFITETAVIGHWGVYGFALTIAPRVG